MARIQTMKVRSSSDHREMADLVRSLSRQLGPKKPSANTRLQGALQQKANAFASDSASLAQVGRQNKVRITFAGSELTVTSLS